MAPKHFNSSQFPYSLFYRIKKKKTVRHLHCTSISQIVVPLTRIYTPQRNELFHFCLCLPSIQQDVLHNEAFNIFVVELLKENPLCLSHDIFSGLHLKICYPLLSIIGLNLPGTFFNIHMFLPKKCVDNLDTCSICIWQYSQ